jgi:heme/copper-type cytochrome/quinol oxidase subunit 2
MNLGLFPTAEASIVTLVGNINRVIINPLILFLMALALIYFLYGVVQYLLSPDNQEIRKSSKSHMLWGVIGLFIMFAVFGIMNIILNTVGEKSRIKINSGGDYHVGDLMK